MTTLSDVKYEAIHLINHIPLTAYMMQHGRCYFHQVKYLAIELICVYDISVLKDAGIHSLEDDAAPLCLAQSALNELYIGKEITYNGVRDLVLEMSQYLNG